MWPDSIALEAVEQQIPFSYLAPLGAALEMSSKRTGEADACLRFLASSGTGPGCYHTHFHVCFIAEEMDSEKLSNVPEVPQRQSCRNGIQTAGLINSEGHVLFRIPYCTSPKRYTRKNKTKQNLWTYQVDLNVDFFFNIMIFIFFHYSWLTGFRQFSPVL